MPTVHFRSDAGTVFPAELIRTTGDSAEIQIEGDPFPVTVKRSQIEENMTTATKTRTARQLRTEAKNLGIADFEGMSKAELQAAVEAAESASNGSAPRKRRSAAKPKTTAKAKTTRKATTRKAKAAPAEETEEAAEETPKRTRTPRKTTAKKTTTRKTTTRKKAPARRKADAKAKEVAQAKKKGTKKPLPMKHRAGRVSKEEAAKRADSDNPYRPGTNIWYITEKLMKGGKRQTLINQLMRSGKIEFTEQVRNKPGFDEEAEIDKRLRVFGYTLRNEWGFGYVMDGRGRDAWIQVFPPGAEIPEKFEGKVEYDKLGGKLDRRKNA